MEGLCYVHVRLRGGERCEDKEGGLRLGGGMVGRTCGVL